RNPPSPCPQPPTHCRDHASGCREPLHIVVTIRFRLPRAPSYCHRHTFYAAASPFVSSSPYARGLGAELRIVTTMHSRLPRALRIVPAIRSRLPADLRIVMIVGCRLAAGLHVVRRYGRGLLTEDRVHVVNLRRAAASSSLRSRSRCGLTTQNERE